MGSDFFCTKWAELVIGVTLTQVLMTLSSLTWSRYDRKDIEGHLQVRRNLWSVHKNVKSTLIDSDRLPYFGVLT